MSLAKGGTLIIFATLREAAPTLRQLKATKDTTSESYRCDLGRIVISGIGALAAATAVAIHGPQAKHILNLGIAGSLNPSHTLGQAVAIQSVGRNPILPQDIDDHSSRFHNSLFPTLTIADEGLRLITSDYPIHHPNLNQQLAQHGDIIDMEGYGIAFAAQQLGIPCEIHKVISDFAITGGPALIQQQIDNLAETIAEMTSMLVFR